MSFARCYALGGFMKLCMVLLAQAIFTAGYKAILHIHSVVEECEIMGLIHQIDPKTKKPIRKKVLFVKSGAVVVVRIQVCCDWMFHSLVDRSGSEYDGSLNAGSSRNGPPLLGAMRVLVKTSAIAKKAVIINPITRTVHAKPSGGPSC